MLLNIRTILPCTLFTPKHQKRLSESFVNVEKVSETFASLEKSGSCDHGYSTKKNQWTNKQTTMSGRIWSNLLATFHSTVPPLICTFCLAFCHCFLSALFAFYCSVTSWEKGRKGKWKVWRQLVAKGWKVCLFPVPEWWWWWCCCVISFRLVISGWVVMMMMEMVVWSGCLLFHALVDMRGSRAHASCTFVRTSTHLYLQTLTFYYLQEHLYI